MSSVRQFIEPLELRRLLAITFTDFKIPTAASQPTGLAVGLDGNLWFAESAGNKIGRVTTGGTITEYPIPDVGSGARDITAGPDGNLWFTEQKRNRVGRITTAGKFLPSI